MTKIGCCGKSQQPKFYVSFRVYLKTGNMTNSEGFFT